MPERAKLVAWTRQLTGRPHIHRAYVYEGKRVVAACSHNHRSHKAAQACADKMRRATAGRCTDQKGAEHADR